MASAATESSTSRIRGLPKPWSVGHANDPKDDDPQFDNEKDAIEAASELAQGPHWDAFATPFAVWNNRGEIVHLFLRGQQFRST